MRNTLDMAFRLPYLRDLFSHVTICHGTDTGIRPYIFGCFHHIDNGVYGENDAHNNDGNTDARHQREHQEETAHRDSGIAYGRNDRDKNPKQDCAEGECHTAMSQSIITSSS